MTLLYFAVLLLTSGATAPSPQRHELWQTGRSLLASIRVVSLTSVFSPAVCLSRCQEEDCTLLTLAVTSSSSGELLDCHLTNVTDWLNKSQVYTEPCLQTRQISCNTFVAIRIPHFYFPLDSSNQLRDVGSLRLTGRQRNLRYGLSSQLGNLFTCPGPSGNPHVKYLLNYLDTNNYLFTNLNKQWQPTTGFTLAVWVMFLGSPTAGPLFEFYSNDQLNNYDNHLWFWRNPAQLYFNDIRMPSNQDYSPVMSMTPGQWYHVAMTWKSGGELVFYWNAMKIYRATDASATMTQFNPSYLLIGARTLNWRLEACFAHAILHTETWSQSQLQHLMLTQLSMP